jgi:hypothetical protein
MPLRRGLPCAAAQPALLQLAGVSCAGPRRPQWLPQALAELPPCCLPPPAALPALDLSVDLPQPLHGPPAEAAGGRGAGAGCIPQPTGTP